MMSKENMIQCIGEEVRFIGLIRDNVMMDNEINTLMDWNNNHLIHPYIGKTCRIIGQDQEDFYIECEFVELDIDGNIINDGITSIEMAFEFAAYSDDILDYDPVFERIPNNLLVP